MLLADSMTVKFAGLVEHYAWGGEHFTNAQICG